MTHHPRHAAPAARRTVGEYVALFALALLWAAASIGLGVLLALPLLPLIGRLS